AGETGAVISTPSSERWRLAGLVIGASFCQQGLLRHRRTPEPQRSGTDIIEYSEVRTQGGRPEGFLGCGLPGSPALSCREGGAPCEARTGATPDADLSRSGVELSQLR